MGMFGWLFRLLGLGRTAETTEATPAEPVVTGEEFRQARRRVAVYLRTVRAPIRAATEARHVWFVELGKLYESIRISPTPLVLDKAGTIGARFQPLFRDALASVQYLEMPPECAEFQDVLIGWMNALESACVALENAKTLKDRRQLGVFREQLTQARLLGKQANDARAVLIYRYKLLPASATRRVGSGVALRTRARQRLGPAAGEAAESEAGQIQRVG